MTYPTARLRTIRPGEQFTLKGESKMRTLIETDGEYGYYKDGFASLCHPLDQANLVWGYGGWRPESRRIEYADAAYG